MRRPVSKEFGSKLTIAGNSSGVDGNGHGEESKEFREEVHYCERRREKSRDGGW